MSEDFCIAIDEERNLWLTEISRATFEDQALDDLGTDGGLFIVLETRTEFRVLAKVPSVEAGMELIELVRPTVTTRSLRVVGGEA